jgi:hypothetical protein
MDVRLRKLNNMYEGTFICPIENYLIVTKASKE